MDKAMKKDEEAHMNAGDLAMEAIEDQAEEQDQRAQDKYEQMEDMDLVGETAPEEAKKAKESKPQLAASSHQVYEALVQLKAYCASTYAKAAETDNTQAEKGSSI